METIAKLTIPRLFDTVRFHVYSTGEPNNAWYYHPAQAIQMHTGCGQAFCATFLVRRGMGGERRYAGDTYYCPSCGAHLSRRFNSTFETSEEEEVPVSMDLEAVEYKRYLDLIIHASCAKFFPRMKDAVAGKRTIERIRFDFQTRKVIYSKKEHSGWVEKDTMWPFECTEGKTTTEDTLLGFILPCANIQGSMRKKLDRFMTAFASTFREKLEDALGHKISSAWTPGSAKHEGHSLWIRPIDNLAWRLACPDAPNLSYPECTMPQRYLFGVRRFIDRCMRGESYLSAARASFGFPDKHSINVRIPKIGMFYFRKASRLLRATGNLEVGVHLLDTVILPRDREEGAARITRELGQAIPFLTLLSRQKGADYMARFLLRAADDDACFRDAVNCYHLLLPENRKIFWDMRVRSRDVHDVLSRLHDQQENANERIPYRSTDLKLAGEVEGLCFSLPPDTDQLLRLGEAMHNCVYSYRNRALAKLVIIVAAFRNREPVICIEIQNNRIMQAKLPCNKPVKEDPVLNHVLLTWAESRELTIATHDVEREKVVASA